MIVVLRRGASEAEILEVEREMERRGMSGRRLQLADQAAVHVIAGPTRQSRKLLRLDQVEGLMPTSGPRLRAEGRRFYPYHFVVQCAACIVLLGALVVLAGFFPAGMGGPIDPRTLPVRISDPWYARATIAFVALFPPGSAWLAWLLLLLGGAAVLLLPVFDRGRGRARTAAVAIAILLAIAWTWLTFAGGAA